MSSTTDVAAQIDCMSPLDEDGRRAVRRYWELVIREELLPVRMVPRAVPLAEDGRRERREAGRAVARIAAAGRVAPVVTLRAPAVRVAGVATTGVAA
jgi:hypothetical protein